MKKHMVPIALLLWCAIALAVTACGDRATPPKAPRVPGLSPSPSSNLAHSWFGPVESAQQAALRSVSFHSFTQDSRRSPQLLESPESAAQPSSESDPASSGSATTPSLCSSASLPRLVDVCTGIGLACIAIFALGWLLRSKS